MKNLAVFTLCVLMACSVCAQVWPKETTLPSTPYYFYNHQIIATQPMAPVLYQNDPLLPQRDAVISLLLQELKDISERLADVENAKKGVTQDLTDMSKRLAETNVKVENVKKEMTQAVSNLKTELAQMKKLTEESKSKSNVNDQKVNDIKIQAALLATPFHNVTRDSEGKAKASARLCNCLMLTAVINTLTADMAGQKIKLNDLTRNLAMSTTPTTMGKVPSSCADLKSLGYQKSGIFSVMGNKQVESVYCDFTKPNDDAVVRRAAFETWIGIVDTKTKRVYFHAQRNSKFDALNIIPFEKLRTNVGEAMELTGIFTAPVPGTYFFAYSGVSFATSQARVDLETKVAPDGDWFRVGEAYATDGNYETYSLQSTLRLSKGDQIRLKLSEGKLHEDAAYHFTNFVGLLLDEDL